MWCELQHLDTMELGGSSRWAASWTLLTSVAIPKSTFALSLQIAPQFLCIGRAEKHVTLVMEIAVFLVTCCFERPFLFYCQCHKRKTQLVPCWQIKLLQLHDFKQRKPLTQEELPSLLKMIVTECNISVTICFSPIHSEHWVTLLRDAGFNWRYRHRASSGASLTQLLLLISSCSREASPRGTTQPEQKARSESQTGLCWKGP